MSKRKRDFKHYAGLATGLCICYFVFGLDGQVVVAIGLGMIGGREIERMENDRA